MKLLCYQIDGGSACDYTVISESQLSGSEAFLAIPDADPIPSGYNDISSAKAWDTYRDELDVDYKVVRQEIGVLVQTKLMTVGWASMSADEQEIGTRYFVLPKAYRDLVYTTEEQIQLGLDYHAESTKARQGRFDHATMEIYNRLTPTEAQEVIDDTEQGSLSYNYIQFGREGLSEGDGEGLFDYIQGNVSSSYSGSGMVDKSFTPVDMTMQELTDKVMDILKNGNY